MDGLEELLELQTRDSELDRLRYRLANLSERSAADEAAERVDLARAALNTAESHKAALGSEQRKIEGELEIVSDKHEQATRTLYGGTVTATRELLGMQADVEMLDRQRAGLEESAIEAMLRVDDAEAECATRREELRAAEAAAGEASAELNRAVDAIEAEMSRVAALRAEAFAVAATSPGLELYEELRSRDGGVVISRLSDGVCGACSLRLSAASETELKTTADIPRCEHCSMILLP